VLLAILPSVAAASASLSPAQILALVKATPALAIEKGVPSSAFDPKTHPYVGLARDGLSGDVGGFLLSEGAHDGLLRDGTSVLAVPLDSEGTGGVFTQLIFARSNGGTFRYVGHLSSDGGHVEVRIEHGAIVVTFPYYGPNDPNCCPSTSIVDTYAIRDGKLVKVAEKRSAIPKGE
jgi:hypothetical protein